MTSPQNQDGPARDPQPEAVERLGAAAHQLQGRTERRAMEVGSTVLAHVLAQPRRSMPVRANGVNAHIHVSEQVLVMVISKQVNAHVEGAAVGQVVVQSSLDEAVEKVLVELIGQYGRDLINIADQARNVVGTVLGDLLGSDDVDVQVVFTHLHVSDITLGDPKLVDPADE